MLLKPLTRGQNGIHGTVVFIIILGLSLKCEHVPLLYTKPSTQLSYHDPSWTNSLVFAQLAQLLSSIACIPMQSEPIIKECDEHADGAP
jgi:hypothetical protein